MEGHVCVYKFMNINDIFWEKKRTEWEDNGIYMGCNMNIHGPNEI